MVFKKKAGTSAGHSGVAFLGIVSAVHESKCRGFGSRGFGEEVEQRIMAK